MTVSLALPDGAGDRDRTGTILSYHGILSPGRLPVPPHRQVFSETFFISRLVYIIISHFSFLVNPIYKNSQKTFRSLSFFSFIFVLISLFYSFFSWGIANSLCDTPFFYTPPYSFRIRSND